MPTPTPLSSDDLVDWWCNASPTTWQTTHFSHIMLLPLITCEITMTDGRPVSVLTVNCKTSVPDIGLLSRPLIAKSIPESTNLNITSTTVKSDSINLPFLGTRKIKIRDGPKFGRRRSSAEGFGRMFGSATWDYSAEVRPNFGKHSASLGLRIGGILRSQLALTKVNTLTISY